MKNKADASLFASGNTLWSESLLDEYTPAEGESVWACTAGRPLRLEGGKKEGRGGGSGSGLDGQGKRDDSDPFGEKKVPGLDGQGKRDDSDPFGEKKVPGLDGQGKRDDSDPFGEKKVPVYWLNQPLSSRRRSAFVEKSYGVLERVGGLQPVRVPAFPGHNALFRQNGKWEKEGGDARDESLAGVFNFTVDCPSLLQRAQQTRIEEGELLQRAQQTRIEEREGEGEGEGGGGGMQPEKLEEARRELTSFCQQYSRFPEASFDEDPLYVESKGSSCGRVESQNFAPTVGCSTAHMLAIRLTYLRGDEWAVFSEDDSSFEPLEEIVNAVQALRQKSAAPSSSASSSDGQSVSGVSVLQRLLKWVEEEADEQSQIGAFNVSDQEMRHQIWGGDWTTVKDEDPESLRRYERASSGLGRGKRAVVVQLMSLRDLVYEDLHGVGGEEGEEEGEGEGKRSGGGNEEARESEGEAEKDFNLPIQEKWEVKRELAVSSVGLGGSVSGFVPMKRGADPFMTMVPVVFMDMSLDKAEIDTEVERKRVSYRRSKRGKGKRKKGETEVKFDFRVEKEKSKEEKRRKMRDNAEKTHKQP
uniref:Uncharacterized protein n=1 Tax=Chromera velia CCMP2878 TaxID=1169474 RepID=A0A0G4IDJ6_9ALVE|eukprot:Cvel_13316.t1-p1 / transcript=Cvel_13316.t1 / gene=Cvel_13316 / organism=Chromera_velia_CCMP2878 / gene_product=hypothetical protein / transcript_product=hypothetical protein / location=Cvel_scaffold904:637-2889(+) / protein_length=584 / sequence_SO=supercontig / SO=protein_coding / is_pseudo=false